MPDELTKYDVLMLRLANGENVPEVTGWGSWMTPCIEHLSERGLIRGEMDGTRIEYVITDAGRAALLKETTDGK